MKIDWNKKYTTIAVYTLIVFSICYLFFKLTDSWIETKNAIFGILALLSPFIYALLLAYFINPLVSSIESYLLKRLKKGLLKRGLAIAISYLIIFSVLIILLSFIIPQLFSSIQEIGRLISTYNVVLQEVLEKGEVTIYKDYYLDLSLVSKYLNDNIESTFNSFTDMLGNFVPLLLSSFTKIASGLMNIILGFIIAVYLLISKENGLFGARKVVFALLPHRQAIHFINLSKESNQIFIQFFVGKLIDSSIIGVICFICLLIFKFPYALLLSVIIGVTNIIPYFGPLFGGFIGFVLLLFIQPVQAFYFMIFVLVLQQFDGNILGPKILGDSTGLSPFWVIFSILIFGKLFGVAGMFLGVPCMAVIKNIVTRQINSRYEKKMTPNS